MLTGCSLWIMQNQLQKQTEIEMETVSMSSLGYVGFKV